jgi:hypothetical protein
MSFFKRDKDVGEEEVSTDTSINLPPPETSVVAEVVPGPAPALVTMWKDGTPVKVPVSEIATMEGLGFLRFARADITSLAREFTAMVSTLTPAVMRFSDSLIKEDCVDPRTNGELHVLTKSWSECEKALQKFLNMAYTNFPMKQGDSDDN